MNSIASSQRRGPWSARTRSSNLLKGYVSVQMLMWSIPQCGGRSHSFVNQHSSMSTTIADALALLGDGTDWTPAERWQKELT